MNVTNNLDTIPVKKSSVNKFIVIHDPLANLVSLFKHISDLAIKEFDFPRWHNISALGISTVKKCLDCIKVNLSSPWLLGSS